MKSETILSWDVNKIDKIKAVLPSTILIWKYWTVQFGANTIFISKDFDFFTHFLHCFLAPQYIKLMVKSCVYVSFVIFWECKWGKTFCVLIFNHIALVYFVWKDLWEQKYFLLWNYFSTFMLTFYNGSKWWPKYKFFWVFKVVEIL